MNESIEAVQAYLKSMIDSGAYSDNFVVARLPDGYGGYHVTLGDVREIIAQGSTSRIQPTMEKNGYTVDRNEQVTVSMGLLDDLMDLISSSDQFKTWGGVTTPDCFVELAATVMKTNQNLFSLDAECIVRVDDFIQTSKGVGGIITKLDSANNEVTYRYHRSTITVHPSRLNCVWQSKDIS